MMNEGASAAHQRGEVDALVVGPPVAPHVMDDFDPFGRQGAQGVVVAVPRRAHRVVERSPRAGSCQRSKRCAAWPSPSGFASLSNDRPNSMTSAERDVKLRQLLFSGSASATEADRSQTRRIHKIGALRYGALIR